MKRILVALPAVALSCGSVNDRPACSASTDCAVGQYCAHTPDGNVCWADAVQPVVSTVTVTCDTTPCRRDGTLTVEASVSDDNEVLGATVSLDLAATPTVAMAWSGATWRANVSLRDYPFEAFARSVVASVVARDGARNESAAVAGNGVDVTRMKWDPVVIDSTTGFVPTVPAVTPNGTIVVGGSTGKLYFVAPSGSGPPASLQVASGQITAAPAVGERAIWVGSEDFWLYGVKLNGSEKLAGVGVNAAAAVRGSVSVLPLAPKEWAFVTSVNGRVNGASDGADTAAITTPDAFAVGPVIRQDGAVCSATSTVTATLRCFPFTGVFGSSFWSASVGSNVSIALAVDASDNIWTVSQDATLYRTSSARTSSLVTTLDGLGVDSPVILSDGDVVIGDQSGLLHRYSPTGTKRWGSEPNLGASVLAPIVLAGGDAVFLVPTKAGTIHAVRGDGSVAWSTSLDATELRAGNIHTPTGQTGRVLSTAYFSASNGRLYAVIVDGQLDASAPWPKAFHDPRNTNRAGPQP